MFTELGLGDMAKNIIIDNEVLLKTVDEETYATCLLNLKNVFYFGELSTNKFCWTDLSPLILM